MLHFWRDWIEFPSISRPCLRGWIISPLRTSTLFVVPTCGYAWHSIGWVFFMETTTFGLWMHLRVNIFGVGVICWLSRYATEIWIVMLNWSYLALWNIGVGWYHWVLINSTRVALDTTLKQFTFILLLQPLGLLVLTLGMYTLVNTLLLILLVVSCHQSRLNFLVLLPKLVRLVCFLEFFWWIVMVLAAKVASCVCSIDVAA